MNRLPTIICIAYLFISNISAQVPSNFNFLNHANRNVEVTEVLCLDDEVVGVHNRGLDFVKYDYDLEKFWNASAEGYKFIYENDSTYHHASWVHQSGDAISNTLIINSYRDTELLSEEYNGVSNFNSQLNQFIDVTYDTTGGWWCITDFGTKLLFLKDNEVVRTIDNGATYPDLFTSCSGDIYILSLGYFLYFDGQDLDYVFELPETTEVFQYEGYNYLLSRDKLYKYDCEMKIKLHEWSLPINVNSFEQINIGDHGNIYINKLNSNSYKIYSIDSLSQITYEYEGIEKEDESIKGIEVSSDSTHLIFGHHQFQLDNQTFYRSINTQQEIDYPTIDVQIADFLLEYSDAGITYDYFSGDSVMIQRTKPKLNITNLSSESIYAIDVFSNSYRVFDVSYVHEDYIRAKVDSTLAPFESRKADNLFLYTTTLEELENIRVELTGANYKFLDNGSQVLAPNLLLSSIESTEIEPFKIYPNPVTDYIKVSLTLDDQVSIFSSDGKLCSQYNVASTSDRIEVSALEPGMYFIILRNKNKPARIAKFVKL